MLPRDLPNRERLITLAARHLGLIEARNRYMNLTRITNPHEAAVKHVLDSILPWRLFENLASVLDAGTGAGFPGIPLAIVLPHVRFTLAESVQKKARFVELARAELELQNVRVAPVRAEELLKTERVDVITARAVAPLKKAIPLFAPVLKRGTQMLLYKGADAEQELTDAAEEAKKFRIRQEILIRYVLPEDFGARAIVELRR